MDIQITDKNMMRVQVTLINTIPYSEIIHDVFRHLLRLVSQNTYMQDFP